MDFENIGTNRCGNQLISTGVSARMYQRLTLISQKYYGSSAVWDEGEVHGDERKKKMWIIGFFNCYGTQK